MSMIKKSLADHYPELIKSWHPHKNGSLTPYKIAPKSNKKVWWQCSQGHEWQALIANRTGVNKTGCPYCAGTKPTDNNNFAALFPHLVNEWDFAKNGSISPNAFKSNSHKKIWWKCKEGHEWQTRIVYRTRQNSGCPYCSGKLAGHDNSLAVLHSNLAKEWHPTKNRDLTPNDVRPGSERKVWWLCDKGHSWEAAIYTRTYSVRAAGCPYCSGRNATVENNLEVLFPWLLSEWHFTKNEPLRPDMLKSGSNRKVWWQCSRGHEWKTSPNKRTGADKTGCPYCNSQTSRLEIRILCELRHILNNVEWRAKIANMEVDIYVPRYSVAIEVDGYRWHVGKDESDKIKGKELFKHGINLFRLRDSKLNIIEATDTLCNDNDDDIDIVHSLLSNLLTHITFKEDDLRAIQAYLRVVTPQNNSEYERLLSYLPSPPPERSLAALYKHLIPEWHYEKNKPLTPDNFTPSARAIVWWICSKGHEYKSFLYNRIKGVGCPYCAGRKVSSDNNLTAKAPELSKEWHYAKNDPIKAGQVYYRSTKKVWWICSEGHEWMATPQKRVLGRGCPYCKNRKGK